MRAGGWRTAACCAVWCCCQGAAWFIGSRRGVAQQA
jgi:hypothetical protein